MNVHELVATIHLCVWVLLLMVMYTGLIVSYRSTFLNGLLTKYYKKITDSWGMTWSEDPLYWLSPVILFLVCGGLGSLAISAHLLWGIFIYVGLPILLFLFSLPIYFLPKLIDKYFGDKVDGND